MRASLLVMLTITLGTLAPAQILAGEWFEEQTLFHDGGVRYYRYYVPDLEPPGGRAVLFVLHGGGGDMRSVTNNGAHAEWPAIADESGILLIVPNGLNVETGDPAGSDQHWNDCRGDAILSKSEANDVGFIAALLDWAETSFTVDSTRVYATGASNGGMMSYRLARELGDRIAAIAAFIANQPAVNECQDAATPIPVFICNGNAEDNYMPWDGGCVVQKSGCQRGTVISALRTRDAWIRVNNTASEPAETIAYDDLDPLDGSTATSTRYEGGFEGAEVVFYEIDGGGHTTPSIEHQRPEWFLQLMGLGRQNHDIEGAREAWAFLSRHDLDGTVPTGPPGVSGLLRVAREPDGWLRIRWAGDCGGGSRFGIYRGDLSLGYDSLLPEPGLCDVDAREARLPPGSGTSDFFLVVPNDGGDEGGYGRDSAGSRRAPSGAACYPQDQLSACIDH